MLGRVRLLSLLAIFLWAACSPAGPPERAFDRAELWVGASDGPPPDGPGWQEVSLPDQWGLQRRRVSTRGWYRLQVPLTEAPAEPRMILLPRLALNAEIYVNGASVGSGGPMGARPARNVLRPLEFIAPAPLWRAGANVVHVHLVTTQGVPGSLHPVWIGSAEELAPVRTAASGRRVFAQATALGMLALGLVVLAQAILRTRKRESDDGGGAWLGAALVLLAAMAVSVFFPTLPAPARVVEWGVGVSFQWAALALAIGVRRAAGPGRSVVEVGFLGAYAAAAVVFALVPWAWAYPFWVLWSLLSGGLLLRAALRATVHAARARSPAWMVGAGLGVTAITALAVQWVGILTRSGSTTAGTLLGGAVLLGVGVFLIRRLVGALRDAETRSEELETRVADREASLAANYERIRKLENAQVVGQERERMTREMHDGTGGLLVAALSLVRREAAPATDLEFLLEEALDDLRLTLDSLQPEQADLPTLLGLLRPRLERQLRSTRLALDWQVSDAGEGRPIPPDAFLHIIRIVQEAVTNAARHSGGTRVGVTTRALPDEELLLEIRDDGSGRAGATTDGDSASNATGRGIANLHHRATQLGARLQVESDEAGTRLRLIVPEWPAAQPPPVANPG
ncbi:MAG: hypothetical protein GY937_26030 [bacterium]|nr:hypothetical protein [bacterium]